MVDRPPATRRRPGPPSDDIELAVRIGKGMAHPTRARVLLACASSSAAQGPVALARGLAVPLGVISYHVRTLAALGLLHLEATSVVRGAVAHHYVVADGVAPALEALMRAARPPGHGRPSGPAAAGRVSG